MKQFTKNAVKSYPFRRIFDRPKCYEEEIVIIT
jgi:hypothetical protein